jgi:uncharacterized membrane protein YdjX (TVP38/TMEM64 family)
MTKKIINILTIVGLLASVGYGIYVWKIGVLTSLDSLRTYIAGFGAWSALFFVAFQAIQVVLPILPGGLGCLVGVLAFGVERVGLQLCGHYRRFLGCFRLVPLLWKALALPVLLYSPDSEI